MNVLRLLFGIVFLCVASAGCDSDSVPLPAGAAGATPAADEPPFMFEVVVPLGPQGGTEALALSGSALQVFRSTSPQAGAAIGWFETELPATERRQLRVAVLAAHAAASGPASQGPASAIRYVAGDHSLQFVIALPPSSQAASELMGIVNRLQQQVLQTPSAAVRLSLRKPASGVVARESASLAVVLANPGDTELRVSLPAGSLVLKASDRPPRANPNITPLPLVWRQIASLGGERQIQLAAGAEVEIPLSFRFPDAGDYQVVAQVDGDIRLEAVGFGTRDGRGLSVSEALPLRVR